MAFTLIQAGTALQLLDDAGTLVTLTLPTGVTLSALRPPRFAIYNRYVVMTNSPSRPITIDANGVVRVLCPRPPVNVPVASGSGVGTLTGTYYLRQTFGIKDAIGAVIAESDYGRVSNLATIAANFLRATNLDVSPDSVSFSRIYRTTTGGSVDGPFFAWFDLDGNTQTSMQDDLADSALPIASGPNLGTPPDLMLIAEFRKRLWGVSRLNPDNVSYTEAEMMYAWPIENRLPIPKLGSDSRGVTALVSRREALGVGRRNVIRQITGTKNENFEVINLTENVGIESQETVVIFRDNALFLWKDGVYQWGPDGFDCVSDGKGGRGNVRSWFAGDDEFNRSQFDQAFAQLLPNRSVYRLFLCAADSTTIDRFVDFDINERSWFGPHKTAAFTPTCGITRPDSDDVLIATVGSSSGYLWAEQATRRDGTSAIALHIEGKRHDARTPIIEKFWGNANVVQVAQETDGNLTMTPTVGELEDEPDTDADGVAVNAQLLDATLSVQSTAVLGVGKFCRIEFTEDTIDQNVQLIGYQIDHHELGDRT